MEGSKNRTKAAVAVLAFVGCYVLLAACSTSPENTTTPPSQLPVTPPNPDPAPSVITDVADINSGQVPKNTRVLVFGQVTTSAGDSDEWNFDDGTGTIVLDFPNNDVPASGVNVLVLGAVDDDDGRREIDVETWEAEATPPTEPVDPPPGRPDPTPPELEITAVRDVVSGAVEGEVILAGQLTGLTPDNECDEWFFTDGTGTVELNFNGCHVPPINTPVYILGKTDHDEVDVKDWALQSSTGS